MFNVISIYMVYYVKGISREIPLGRICCELTTDASRGVFVMKVLLVEDDHDLSSILMELMEEIGCDAEAVFDGQTGLAHALTGVYDVIVLDVMLPALDGLSIVKKLRGANHDTPVLMLTAKAEIEDRINGLNAGADDYLTKPFATGEFLARLQALSRRPGVYIADVIAFGDMALDKTNRWLSAGEKKVQLSAKEYQILEILLVNAPNTIRRERIIERVWGFESNAEYNACDVYISFLRKKLKAIGAGVQIKTVRGLGYTLEAS